MNNKRILDFIDFTVENEYNYEEEQLRSFSRDEIVELLSMLMLRVESREIELKNMVETLEAKVHERTIDLREKNRILKELSIRDELTKLFNRRFFDEKLKEYSLLSQRFGHILTCIMSDIDHFKNFNDTYGHQAGDSVLFNVAQILRNNIRRTDICTRYGGEEFVILLPNTSLEAGVKLAEKLRKRIELSELLHDGETLKITSSFGAAAGDEESNLGENLVKRADLALYSAKQSGRNCVRS